MVDVNSATWELVETRLSSEIAKAQVRLETPGLSLAETEFERGRLKALRDILAMSKPPVQIPS